MAMYRKIHKGEFRCLRWFSTDLFRLLHRLLDTNPQIRITIPELMEHPWFKKGFRRVRFYIEDDQLHSLDDASSSQQEPVEADDSGSESDTSVVSCPETSSHDRQRRQGLPQPPSLNAFRHHFSPPPKDGRRQVPLQGASFEDHFQIGGDRQLDEVYGEEKWLPGGLSRYERGGTWAIDNCSRGVRAYFIDRSHRGHQESRGWRCVYGILQQGAEAQVAPPRLSVHTVHASQKLYRHSTSETFRDEEGFSQCSASHSPWW
ncbi:unnamed protein product, partial [Musa acuminata subsp. burmannicoides]